MCRKMCTVIDICHCYDYSSSWWKLTSLEKLSRYHKTVDYDILELPLSNFLNCHKDSSWSFNRYLQSDYSLWWKSFDLLVFSTTMEIPHFDDNSSLWWKFVTIVKSSKLSHFVMTIIACMPQVKIRCLNIHIHTNSGLGFLLLKVDWSARAIIIIYLNKLLLSKATLELLVLSFILWRVAIRAWDQLCK